MIATSENCADFEQTLHSFSIALCLPVPSIEQFEKADKCRNIGIAERICLRIENIRHRETRWFRLLWVSLRHCYRLCAFDCAIWSSVDNNASMRSFKDSRIRFL